MSKPKMIPEVDLRAFMEAEAAHGKNFQDGHLWAQAYRSYTRAEAVADVLSDVEATNKYGGMAAYAHAKSEEVQ